MKFRMIVLIVLMGSLLTLSAFGQDNVGQIDEYMQQIFENDQFNGSILVAESGKIIYKKGFGLANMEWNIPNAPDTKFRLGSITKQFTSLLIMQEVEKGTVKLDEKMTTYLPDYRKDTGDKITVHHLLTHTSGIPSYTRLPGFIKDLSRDPYHVDDFVAQHCSGDLEFEPGSQFRYNNSGYFLLGAILEKVTGQTYEMLANERIFQPLNMQSSGYDWHEPIITKRAAGYEKGGNGFVNASYIDMSIPYAAGSLYSTVEDMFLWDRALYTDQLLPKDKKAPMFEPHFVALGGHYSYGWILRYHKLSASGDV